MQEEFLLESPAARSLYRAVRVLPILDYHCHLDPKELYEDRPFASAGALIFGRDHYKWRLMRSAGISEEYITGERDEKEKFIAYARAISLSPANPLVDFTTLELSRFFGIEQRLCEETAADIYDEVQQQITERKLSPRKIVCGANVRLIATTDDPADSLEYHRKMREEGYEVRVLPSFRTDRVFSFEKTYLALLEETSGVKISSLETLLAALSTRLDFFCENGCRVSDVGIEQFPHTAAEFSKADTIFRSVLRGDAVSEQEKDALRGTLFVQLGRLYREKNIIMQWHMAVKRNACLSLSKKLGADCGSDCMGEPIGVDRIAALLNGIEADGKGLPRTILYCLNPAMRDAMCSLSASFCNVHIGAAWWFLDHRRGIRETLSSLAEAASLSSFPGMLTDSRSFLSYARHDFFRRILSSFLAQSVNDGTLSYPNAEKLARRLSYETMRDWLAPAQKSEIF